eukprot:5804284-Pyramimonas_sp.AAC.1
MGAKGGTVALLDQLALPLDALGQNEDMQDGKASLADARAVAAKAKDKLRVAERAAAAAKEAPSTGGAPAADGPWAPAGGGAASGGMGVEAPDFKVDQDLADQ